MKIYHMGTKGERIKIKIRLSLIDWIFEFVGFLFVIMLLILPIIYMSNLPDKIPIQFNGLGEPKNYGSKNFIWLFPIVGGFLYIILTTLSQFPQLYNFPVKITPENILVQYKLATRLVRILKTILILMFLFTCYQTIRISTGETNSLGNPFVPLFLILNFGIIAIYLTRSIKNKF